MGAKVGDIFGCYRILDTRASVGSNGSYQCLVECCSCGHRSIKGMQELRKKKTGRCQHCPPSYNFEIKNGTAKCKLPDGSDLVIDEEDVPKIKDFFWWDNGMGYVLTQDKQSREKIQIHRLILGLEKDSPIIVDHINRNKHDNRKANLRLVTQHQNSMNNPLKKNNTTGYTGVWLDKKAQKYSAKIMFKRKGISLGRSFDIVECAQMYNHAAMLLFGEFAGHKNDVPEPSEELKRKIEGRCRPYMEEAAKAAQPCSLFSCLQKGV